MRGEPKKTEIYDMKRFRQDLRAMWREMQFQYKVGVRRWYAVQFPEIQTLRARRIADDE